MDDLISRQAAIDFIDAGHLVNPNEPRWSDNEVVNFLKSRPSAQRTGRWAEWTKGRVMCPFCKKEPVAKGWETFIYCPHCGASMEVKE